MIKILCVGKVKEPGLKELIQEYTKRLSAFDKVNFVEVKEEIIPASNSLSENQIAIEKESNRLLDNIKEDEYVILLSLKGKDIDSLAFSGLLDDIRTNHTSKLTFVIGGSLGTSQKLADRANYLWKLSNLTYPHQLVRLMILEQIYRGFKIINHQPYHK